MATKHTVEPGDGLSSIAAAAGHRSDTLWQDPANGTLAGLRKEPDVLAPGDVVTVPPIRVKEVDAETGKRHRFKRVGVPGRFKIHLRFCGQVLKDTPYLLELGERTVDGTTDGDGYLTEFVPLDLKQGKLSVKTEEVTFERVLRFGGLDPVEEETGVTQRLAHLAFYALIPEDEPDPDATALASFQDISGLEATGKIDDATRDALAKIHAGEQSLVDPEASSDGSGGALG